MADPTLPNRPWEVGQWELVIDKNGINRRVAKNPNPQLDDHMRYERDKNAPEQMAKRESGYFDDTGGSTAVPEGSSGPAPPQEKAASPPKPEDGEWLQAIVQRYANEAPMNLSLDKNAPVVTPEMLTPSEQELQQMDPDTREGIGRVFLAVASKYYGDHTLQQAVLYGTKIKGYVPGKVIQYFRWLTGRG